MKSIYSKHEDVSVSDINAHIYLFILGAILYFVNYDFFRKMIYIVNSEKTDTHVSVFFALSIALTSVNYD